MVANGKSKVMMMGTGNGKIPYGPDRGRLSASGSTIFVSQTPNDASRTLKACLQSYNNMELVYHHSHIYTGPGGTRPVHNQSEIVDSNASNQQKAIQLSAKGDILRSILSEQTSSNLENSSEINRRKPRRSIFKRCGKTNRCPVPPHHRP